MRDERTAVEVEGGVGAGGVPAQIVTKIKWRKAHAVRDELYLLGCPRTLQVTPAFINSSASARSPAAVSV